MVFKNQHTMKVLSSNVSATKFVKSLHGFCSYFITLLSAVGDRFSTGRTIKLDTYKDYYNDCLDIG